MYIYANCESETEERIRGGASSRRIPLKLDLPADFASFAGGACCKMKGTKASAPLRV